MLAWVAGLWHIEVGGAAMILVLCGWYWDAELGESLCCGGYGVIVNCGGSIGVVARCVF